MPPDGPQQLNQYDPRLPTPMSLGWNRHSVNIGDGEEDDDDDQLLVNNHGRDSNDGDQLIVNNHGRDADDDDQLFVNNGGYDADGYDANGYNAEGFAANGYNAEGYDANGYNADGLDADGFDADRRDTNGYDSDGYDMDGYDSDGFDGNGYKADGYNSDGYDMDGYNAYGYNAEGYDAHGNMNSNDNDTDGSLFGGNGGNTDGSDAPMRDADADAGDDSDDNEDEASGGDGERRESSRAPEAAGGGGAGGSGSSGGSSDGDSSGDSDSSDDDSSGDSESGDDEDDSDSDSDASNGGSRTAIPLEVGGAVHDQWNRARQILSTQRDELLAQVRELTSIVERLQARNNGHTERTWQEMLRPCLGGQPDAAYREVYNQCCKEENMSMVLQRRHPDIVFVACDAASRPCRDVYSVNIRPIPVPGGQSFPFTRLPPELKVKIFKLWLVKEGKIVHCFSRLDRFKPPTTFPLAEDLVIRGTNPRERRSGLPRGFYWGDRECSLTRDCKKPCDVLRLLLVSKEFNFIGAFTFYGLNTFAFSSLGEFYRFGKGIGLPRLARIQHIELTWLGSQYLTTKIPPGKTKRPFSARTSALYWLQQAPRLRTLVVHINETAKIHMRRAYEATRLVEFMDLKTRGQPNQRKTRSMRTVQAMDCVYQLRGMDFIRFYDLEQSADSGERTHIRDWSFLEDVNNTGCMEKVPIRLAASQLEVLPPLVPGLQSLAGWNPSARLFAALQTLYDETKAWDEVRDPGEVDSGSSSTLSSDSGTSGNSDSGTSGSSDSGTSGNSDSGRDSQGSSSGSSPGSSSSGSDSGNSWNRFMWGDGDDDDGGAPSPPNSLFDGLDESHDSDAGSRSSRLFGNPHRPIDLSSDDSDSDSDADSGGSGLFVNQGPVDLVKKEEYGTKDSDDDKDNLDPNSSDNSDSESENNGSRHTSTGATGSDSNSGDSKTGHRTVLSNVIDISSDDDSYPDDEDSITEVPGSYRALPPQTIDVDALPDRPSSFTDGPLSFTNRAIAMRTVFGERPSRQRRSQTRSSGGGLFVSPNPPETVISTPEPGGGRRGSVLARRSHTRESSGLFVSPRQQTQSLNSTPQPGRVAQGCSHTEAIDLTRDSPYDEDDDDVNDDDDDVNDNDETAAAARARTPLKRRSSGSSDSASSPPAPKRQKTETPSPPAPEGI